MLFKANENFQAISNSPLPHSSHTDTRLTNKTKTKIHILKKKTIPQLTKQKANTFTSQKTKNHTHKIWKSKLKKYLTQYGRTLSCMQI